MIKEKEKDYGVRLSVHLSDERDPLEQRNGFGERQMAPPFDTNSNKNNLKSVHGMEGRNEDQNRDESVGRTVAGNSGSTRLHIRPTLKQNHGNRTSLTRHLYLKSPGSGAMKQYEVQQITECRMCLLV